MAAVQQSQQLSKREADALHLVKTMVINMDPAAEKLSDSDYLRFLRARDFDTQKAANLLAKHLKWRRSFVPRGNVQEEEIAKELEREQFFLQGHDKFGCAIIIVLHARHAAFERDLEEFMRLFVYFLDKAAASSNRQDQGKVMLIVDLAGWGIRNMDIRGALAALDILQSHYPERLRKLLVLHVPYLFWGAWKVISPAVDNVTREKIVFVEDQNLEEILSEEVEKDQLPTIYGGQQSLIAVEVNTPPNWPSTTIAS